MENKTKIPTEIEKLDKKIEDIEKKIGEYKERKEEKLEKRNKKQKDWLSKRKMMVEDTWGMMVWLTKYIEDNKSDWERRRQEPPENELEKWTRLDEEEMIRILQETEAEQVAEKETKKDKAEKRKENWKNWRQAQTRDDIHDNDDKEIVSDKGKEIMEEYVTRNLEMVKRRR